MPNLATAVDCTWTNGMTMDEAELRRADTAMFLGDGTANGVRGGIIRHSDTSLAVAINGSDQITVQPGAFVIPAAAGLGVYRGAIQAVTTPTGITARNGTNPRIDLIVIQIVSGQGQLKTIDGNPSSSPVAPTLPAQHIELARLTVPPVAGGAVSISTAFRQYTTTVGGLLPVETAAQLPGSGNLKGQHAVAIDTGVEYQWSGTAWVSGSPMPTGSSMEWWTNTPPAGYLLMNGAAVSRTTYAALFAVLGTTFGTGDGSTTFNLPNPLGRTVVSRDAGQAEFDVLGETGGAKTHILSVPEMPSHGHGVTDPGHAHNQTIDSSYNVGAGGAAGKYAQNNTGVSPVQGGFNTSSSGTGISINNNGGGGAHNNLQPYIVANRIIKT